MTDPVLRAARSAEAAALAALKLASFRQTFLEEGFGVPYPPADLALFERDSYAPDRVAVELADPRRRTWVAEADGALVAYAQAGPCKLPHPDVADGAGEIYQLYVLRGHQGGGLGRRLLARALDHLAAAHPGPAWLGVWSGNAPAQAFYARHGFRRVGDYGFPVGGGWVDQEYILRRDRPAE